MSNMLLAVHELNKSYESGTEKLTILDNMGFELEAGRSLAIVGASGCGKSTLLYILGGLTRPDSGTIAYNGKNILNLNDEEIAIWRNKSLGFIFQSHHLLADFTALENVAMPARLAGLSEDEAFERAKPLLKRVGLANRLDHFPGTLSGGEQQRVAIARALVMGPDLLLADEPTGNLDPKNAESVNELILELVSEQGLTAIVVTHNHILASLMDEQKKLFLGRLI